jgi:hypothetical protein
MHTIYRTPLDTARTAWRRLTGREPCPVRDRIRHAAYSGFAYWHWTADDRER